MAFEILQGPPRSGKKEYLKKKLKKFIESGISTDEILVLTNSVQSAEDIKKFAKKHLDSYSELWIESVTSFCKKILRENYYYTDMVPGFRIITDFEKRLIVRTLLKRDLHLKYFKTAGNREGLVREISNFIDVDKRNSGWTEKIKSIKGPEKQKYRELEKIFQLYKKELKGLNYADFVDLHLNTKKLVRKHPDLLDFKVLMSYETEDMDLIMGDVIYRLAENSKHVHISINPDLSIYNFRGARPRKLRWKLKQKFNFKIKNPGSEEKIKSKNTFIETPTRDDQAEMVADDIGVRLKKGKISPSDIIIMARSVGENMELFTQALKSRGINSLTLGGIGFFRQPEIIELMSVLAFIDHKTEDSAINLRRVLRLTVIFSETEIDMLHNKSVIESKSMLIVMEENEPDRYRRFCQYIEVLRKRSRETGLLSFIYYIMEEFGFLKTAAAGEFSSRLYSYFYKIVEDYARHFEKMEGRRLTFKLFMKNLYELLSGFGKDMNIPHIPKIEAVKIMTVQQAKNIRCKLAYVVDMVEDTFPRPFFENPLLKIKDYENLGFKPVFDIEKRYKFEERLYRIASTRGGKETVHAWYNFDNSGKAINKSEFLEEKKLSQISYKSSETIINVTDFICELAENIPGKIINEIEVPGKDFKKQLKLLYKVKQHNPANFFDRVRENLPQTFSYTMLESYVKCPRILFYRYIMNIDEPDTIYKSFGIAVHRIFQKIYDIGVTNRKEALQKLKIIWSDLQFCSEFESRNLYKKALNILKEYFKGPAGEDFKIKSLEVDFKINIDEIKIRGRCDREDELPNGEKRIVDYKTGKRVPATRGLLNAVERGENFQIPIYKWARNSRYFTVCRLRKKASKMNITIDFSKKRAARVTNEAKKRLKKVVSGIKNGKFPARPAKSNNCRFCYYARLCDNND